MAPTVPAFTPLQASLWLTLCGRALDNRLPLPILGDKMADEIVRKVDYDYKKLRIPSGSVISIAHRAKKLDEVAQRFLARNPDGVGLDLGAGLDSRVLRITPPPTADWYDIDLPEVMAARQDLLPAEATPHGISADLTGGAWLDSLPTDRPVVAVADGLIAFLSEQEMISLVGRIIDHFPSGEIAFNGYSTFAVRMQKIVPVAKVIREVTKFPGFNDPKTPERWHPKLKLAREILCTREPEVDRFPPFLRLMNRMSAPSAAVSRLGNTILVYRF
ncbi:class I SAM-dependent methyltransferase [Nonomuraea pusilla]|uniref:O-Methyltransferase involved in polyketide biosynthesis n=1 Tax=Nonomuraea pusilla TaxID=46177 RepID=A0A1H8IBA9_9ACTN|nr:class I SAM-dependent methyltransferase [Nonomuraea pusilla]SEN66040.1 O-Methyltransferase involved in polyketide biosynthesis [Nonomuraea pusilla]